MITAEVRFFVSIEMKHIAEPNTAYTKLPHNIDPIYLLVSKVPILPENSKITTSNRRNNATDTTMERINLDK